MTPRALIPLALALCAAPAALPGQTRTLISPTQAASIDGSSANLFPFAQTLARRYQQIHSDLGPGAKSIRQLSFRMTQNTANWTGVRRIDLEMLMGRAPAYHAVRRDFARNFSGPGTRVMRRRVVSFGPQGRAVRGPNPFRAMDLMLDAPYPYVGPASLIWEVRVFANNLSNGAFASLDADRGSWILVQPTVTGTGCVATGQTTAMFNDAKVVDIQGFLGFGAGCRFAPPRAPVVLALGSSNPNLAVAGLCGRVFTNLLLIAPAGVADANGRIWLQENLSLHLPNTFGGAVLFTQLHALDTARRDPIKVANTQGLRFVVPRPDTTKVVLVSRMVDSSNTTTAKHGLRFTDTTIGYGLVTRFTYR